MNTSKPRSPSPPRDAREWIALTTSIAIAAAAFVYWIVQIDGVLAMLKLAYG